MLAANGMFDLSSGLKSEAESIITAISKQINVCLSLKGFRQLPVLTGSSLMYNVICRLYISNLIMHYSPFLKVNKTNLGHNT